MIKTLSLLLLLTQLTSFSQNRSYYISATNGRIIGDLLLVDYQSNSHTVKKTYCFKDSIYETNMKENTSSILNYIPTPDTKKDSTNQLFNMNFGPISINTLDSIKVDNKWYIIKFHFDDDRFVGGMPNHVNKKIWVTDLGTIYSYNNFLSGHELVMLSTKDSTKQDILHTIYQHLEKTNQWFNWAKMKQLNTSYEFHNCFTQLSTEWNTDKEALKLIHQTSTIENGKIIYQVTIKNTSLTHYVLPEYYMISPSKATILTSTGKGKDWDLIDTHYGRHYKRINIPHYIESGEELSFSQTLSITLTSGPKLNYHGFQIYSQRTFSNWLFNEDVIHSGRQYKIFSHREIFF